MAHTGTGDDWQSFWNRPKTAAGRARTPRPRPLTESAMPAVHVDPRKVHEFETAAAFEAWLRANHDRETEVWIKLHKKSSLLPSVSPKEAIDVALCWGWIDAVRKSLDATSYLQRYTPRTRKSIWSQANVANVARLGQEGRMTEHGLRQVELAQADGRWERAYGSGQAMALPDDLLAAVEAEPKARATLPGSMPRTGSPWRSGCTS